MKCIICDIGVTEPGMTTVTLQRDGTIIVFKSVLADVCQVCGEAYTDQQVTRRLLQVANEEAQKGPRKEFIQYIA